MTPLVPLDDPSGSFTTAATKTAVESGIGYFVVSALTWVVSRITVGRTLKRMEKTIASLQRDRFTKADFEALMHKMDKAQADIAEVSQEVFGAKSSGGLAERMEAINERVEAVVKSTAAIEGQLKLLVRQLS